MVDRRGKQKGPQSHAEDQHGDKTHSRLVEQLHATPQEEAVEERVDRKRDDGAYEGKRRLLEDREQHDEAEKNSEQNSRASSVERRVDD